MKNKIWFYPIILIGIVFLFTNSCKKDEQISNSTNDWFALGGKQDLNSVYDLYVDDTGNLYAAGAFKNSSGNYYVAKWDGNKWSEVGTLNINGNIFTICGDPSGNLYIGGAFTDSNRNTYVAKWNGTSWTNIGSTTSYSGYIHSLISDASGNIYMAADGLNFDGTLNGNVSVVKWNGSSWSRMGSFLDTYINSLCIDGSGNIYAGGGGLSAAPNGGYVAKWNGSDWDKTGDLDAYEEVYTLTADVNGNIYAGGGFNFQSGFVVKWNGSNWTDLNLNGNDDVKASCMDTKGNLYTGGSFNNSDNKFYVAKWNGSSWSDMGLNAYSGIYKLLYSNGYLYVAGNLEFELNSGHYIAAYKIL